MARQVGYHRVTRRKVLYREIELTDCCGDVGKIERSAEAFRIKKSIPFEFKEYVCPRRGDSPNQGWLTFFLSHFWCACN